MTKLIVIVCLVAGVSVSSALPPVPPPNWSYQNADQWSLTYPDCGRKYQEPQDIPYETIDACFQPLVWKNLEWPQNNRPIINTNRELLVNLDLSYPILVAGGPLAAQTWYYGTRLSIKFGINDTVGSERTIRGRSYPVEIKLELSVERDAVLTDFANSEGRAVISWMAEVSPDTDLAWESLLTGVALVTRGGSTSTVSFPSVAALLPHYEDWEKAYFTYPGSWATPPCYPDVTRIVYSTPIPLSSAQLAVLRLVKNEYGISQGVKGVRRPFPPTDNRQFLRSFH